jgi:hypothetical protein
MIVVVLAVGLIWYLMPIFGFKSELTIIERKDLVQGLASVVQALAVVLTGTVGLIGLLFTWRNLGQTRESTQRTLELTEQGQITDRFTRAIDQLGTTDGNGDPRLEIRLGGIYALERIARDSPQRDYNTVMEVLTAYVRENAGLTSGKGATEGDDETEQIDLVNADIQAVLDVIGRRQEQDPVPEEDRVRMNLSRSDLSAARLRRANLLGVVLREARLSGANLRGADLREADLREADLTRADLTRADLRKARLRGANVWGANLLDSDLRGADLSETKELLQEQIEDAAFGDKTTKLRKDLTPPAAWS